MSRFPYILLEPTAQAVVVTCPVQTTEAAIRERWGTRAAAALGDSVAFLPDLVRDLLANPHIRVVVFHGTVCAREAYETFWRGTDDPGWGISIDHLALVRQFVDLYDDDFSIKGPMPPYWPTRIRYHDKEKP